MRLCQASGHGHPLTNYLALNYDSSADKVCDMAEKLTFSSSVMGNLMLGTGLPQLPRKLWCQIASRVRLEEIVKVADGVILIHAQCPGQKYMTRGGCSPLLLPLP